MKKKKMIVILISMVIISLLSTLFCWWFYFFPYVSTDDSRVAMTMIKLATTGGGGRVEKVFVEEGIVVKKNQVLLELDHRIASANLDRAIAHAKLAEREFNRISSLVSQNSATKRDFDKARAEMDISQAELKLAEVALDNTYLKSPIDGIVVQKLVEVGNILENNQVALILADNANAWIAANIEENYIGLLKIGQRVDIAIDEGGKLIGKVREIRHAVASQFALIPTESSAGNFTKLVQRVPIKIEIERVQGKENAPLRAGESVEIKIHVR